jgi:hypothetical protein
VAAQNPDNLVNRIYRIRQDLHDELLNAHSASIFARVIWTVRVFYRRSTTHGKLKNTMNTDPQSTLPPRQPETTRNTETRGRRLILGTPTRNPVTTPAASASDGNPAVQRGFTLGRERTVNASPSRAKTGVQPWVLVVAGGALVLLVIALLLRPSATGSAEAIANERLLAQYTKYLQTKGIANSSDLEERRKHVVGRLQAVEWAKALGDKSALESELTALLFLDNDKGSPLYQYSVTQLKQLGPPKKRTGL